jgi:hypothetical protein
MAITLTTAKMTPAALQAARLIAAATGEKQSLAVQRVLEAEAVRLGVLKAKKAAA